MASNTEYKTVIFDLGDVLFSWSPKTKTDISPLSLKKILSSSTWFEYECGFISENACYQRIADQFSFEPSQVADAFAQARDSLQSNDELIAVIQELKIESNGTLQVYAMSNISLPDYEILRTKPADWSIFDQVFTSGAAGERKPSVGFFQQVLDSIHTPAENIIFVDDKSENVLAAESLGMCGIVFDDTLKVARTLRNLLGDPVKRGLNFLNDNARHTRSITDTNVYIDENFTQLLILEATNRREFVTLHEHPRIWNFFIGEGSEGFPCDLDTTSVGLMALKYSKEVVHSVMDEMLEYVGSNGIIQTYFDHTRSRFDPTVCVNVLTLFYSYGRGHELSETFQWVYEVLLHREYLEGTRYYATPECFLFFVSRLIGCSTSPELHVYLKPLLAERIQERMGEHGDPLALAMRILVCKSVGVRAELDLHALLSVQCDDGAWEPGWIYKYGKSGVRIGNRSLTTAYATKAILAMEEQSNKTHLDANLSKYPSRICDLAPMVCEVGY